MKKMRFVLLALLIYPGGALFALPFDMILVGDPVLQDIRFVSLESGSPFLSFTPPLAPAQVEIFLDSIDASLLSAPALQAYYRIRRRLIPQASVSFFSDNFSLFLDINATLEGRARFNSDIAWDPAHPNISPLLALPLRLHFANTVQLYIEPIISVTQNSFSPSGRNFSHNIPRNYNHYDSDMPFRAFLAAGGSWWNFQIGRDRLFWGTGHTGSLTFSDNADFFDFARLSFFSRFFKYSVFVSQMPLTVHDSFLPPLPPNYDWNDLVDITSTTQRHFYLHRLDVLLFRNRVSLGLMEGVMVGNSPLELRFLNPMMIFHSLFAWNDYGRWLDRASDPRGNDTSDMVGSYFSLELNWRITNSLFFHAQFVMNEFATPDELRHRADQPPDAMGYMAGLTFSHSFNTWAAIFFIEFIYTDPYLYMLSTPFASFIHMRRPATNRYYFIGHSRDTISLSLGGRFFNGETLNFTGILSWIASGENNSGSMTWDWSDNPDLGARNRRTPSGTVEHKFAATVGAGWRPMPRIGFNGSITGIAALNNNHISGSDIIGGQVAFSVNFRY